MNAGLGVNNGIVEYCWFEDTGSPPGDHGTGAGYSTASALTPRKTGSGGGTYSRTSIIPISRPTFGIRPCCSGGTRRHRHGTEHRFQRGSRRRLRVDNTTPYFDHAGGVIRNNFVCLAAGLMSASRKAGSDGSLIAWNRPARKLTTTASCSTAMSSMRSSFASRPRPTAPPQQSYDAPVHLRDSATATLSSNLVTAVPGMFVNAAVGDLHLLASATNAIDQAPTLSTVTNDFDGEPRPRGARSDIGADEFTTNAPPSFSGVKVSGPNAIVGILTLLGESYDLLRANDLAGSAWTAIATDLPGSGEVISITDANGAIRSRGFYRSRLSP